MKTLKNKQTKKNPEKKQRKQSDTFIRMQELEQGAFQKLGDAILPHIFPELIGLQPNGLNEEGKTTKGIPDSFVGESSEKCCAAIEYTTQKTNQEKKFKDDFDGVVKKSKNVSFVVLASNRSYEKSLQKELKEDAEKRSIKLDFVDGEKIAKVLDEERQDLRCEHFGIPINKHTKESLIGALNSKNKIEFERFVEGGTLFPRKDISRKLDRYLYEKQKENRIAVIKGSSGIGKSTLTLEWICRLSETQPAIWLRATEISKDSQDPISLSVIHKVYGVSDSARESELAELFFREQLKLVVIIDGCEEVTNYKTLRNNLIHFQSSTIGKHTKLLISFREESEVALFQELRDVFSDKLEKQPENQIHIPPLDETEIKLFLKKLGLDSTKIRELENSIDKKYIGIPFFLKQAANIIRKAVLSFEKNEFIRIICSNLLNDLESRLKQNGVSLSSVLIREIVERISFECFKNDESTISSKQLIKLGYDELKHEGESSFISRAIQSGILRNRGKDKFEFSHSIIIEYFCSSYIINQNDTILLQQISKSRQNRLVENLVFLSVNKNKLQAELCEIDIELAIKAACFSKEIDKAVEIQFSSKIKELLSSRFPSDLEYALELLSGLRGNTFKKIAVDWWNNLSEDLQKLYARKSAELFLNLEISEAAFIVAHHNRFIKNSVSWYEPKFVEKISLLCEAFKRSLRDFARSEWDNYCNEKTPIDIPKILTLIRDDHWLLEKLLEKLKNSLLNRTEHRALIFINTKESLDIYFRSVERYFELYEKIDRNIDNTGSESSSIWHQIVLKQTDIIMHPHDNLVALIRKELISSKRINVSFAIDWMETIKCAELNPLVVKARKKHKSPLFMLYNRSIIEWIQLHSFEEIICSIKSTNEIEYTKEIARYLYECPGVKTEKYLIDCLKDENIRFNALQSLGSLRSRLAGPKIFELLNNKEPRWEVIDALGKIKYRQATDYFCEYLKKTIEKKQSKKDNNEKNGLEYFLIQAIGRIGERKGMECLFELYDRSDCKDEILRMLIHAFGKDGIKKAEKIIEKNPTHPLVSNAIIAFDNLEDSHTYDGGVVSPWIMSQMLFDNFMITFNRKNFLEYVELQCFGFCKVDEILQEIAEEDPHFDEKDNSAKSGINYVLQARNILAERGNKKYIEWKINYELSMIESSPYFSSYKAPYFFKNIDSSEIRKVVIKKLEKAELKRVKILLMILNFYKNLEDRSIFEKFENHEDIDVADYAHWVLRTF